MFHEAHGFYIDGVDANTATLPPGWQDRVIHLAVQLDGATVTAIAPSPEDLVVSKLARLDAKDIAYIQERHRFRPLDIETVADRLAATEIDDATRKSALAFLSFLAEG